MCLARREERYKINDSGRLELSSCFLNEMREDTLQSGYEMVLYYTEFVSKGLPD